MLKAERIEVETSWKSTYATSFAINKQRKMGLKGPASLIGSWNLPISLERIKPFMIPIDHGGKRHRKSNSLSFRQSFKPNEGSNLGAAHRKQSTIQSQPMFGKQEPQLLELKLCNNRTPCIKKCQISPAKTIISQQRINNKSNGTIEH